MAAQAQEVRLQPLVRTFDRARRWLWLQRVLLSLARSAVVALSFCFLAALLSLWQAPGRVVESLWTSAAIAPVAGLVLGLVLRPSTPKAARLVDLRLDLAQQLGTAHELLTRGRDGTLVRLQLDRAADLAGRVRVSSAFPLFPRGEAVALLVLAAGTGLLTFLVSLGVVLPNPFTAIHLPFLSKGEQPPAEQALFEKSDRTDNSKPRSPALDATRQMVSEIQRQADRGSLSSLASSSALAQASSELNRVADESRARREALDNLSKELRNTSAGLEAAQSLWQGNFDQAAHQLRDLGRDSSQLSPAARQQLAQALNNAAARSQAARDLSRAESRAAQAFERNDSSQVSQTMDRLARAVQDAAKQVVSQEELAEAWQQLDDLNKDLTSPGSEANQGSNPVSPPTAQSGQGTEQGDSGVQPGANPGDQPGGDSGALANSSDSNNLQPGSSGQPGNSPGSSAMGNPNQQVGPDGKALELEGQIGDRFSSNPETESKPSVMREGEANSVAPPGGSAAEGPVSVPAENVFVPGDRRSIVRDYFTRGAGAQ